MNAFRRLPHWAKLVIAIRCARRGQSVIRLNQQDASATELATIESAFSFCERAARLGDRSSNAFRQANHLAGEAARIMERSEGRLATRLLASAAVYATDAALGAGEDRFSLSLEAAVKVWDSRDFVGMMTPATWSTFREAAGKDAILLTHLATELNWTDDSPVDAIVLGSLWSPGQDPALVMTLPKDTDIAGLEVTYTVPDGMSDEDAIRLINKHLAAMSDMHRALGGKGLRVIPPTDVQEPAKTRVMVGA
jgi:hypothetical protein